MKFSKPSKYDLFEYLDEFSEPVKKSVIAEHFSEPMIIADLSEYVHDREIHKFNDNSFMLTSKGRQYLQEKRFEAKQYKETKIIAIVALIFSFISLIPSVIIPFFDVILNSIPG